MTEETESNRTAETVVILVTLALLAAFVVYMARGMVGTGPSMPAATEEPAPFLAPAP